MSDHNIDIAPAEEYEFDILPDEDSEALFAAIAALPVSNEPKQEFIIEIIFET